jgi:iron complex outermembrane receptor protein
LFGYDPLTGNPTFAGNLKPQTGTLGEIGGSLALGPLTGPRCALPDEPGTTKSPTTVPLFSNVNLDADPPPGPRTRSRLAHRPLAAGRVTYTYAASTFREGIYDGNQVPLVPNNKARARACPGMATVSGNIRLVANYVGQRYYSGDLPMRSTCCPATPRST